MHFMLEILSRKDREGKQHFALLWTNAQGARRAQHFRAELQPHVDRLHAEGHTIQLSFTGKE